MSAPETDATTVRLRIRPSNSRESGTKPCICKSSEQQVSFASLDGGQSAFQYDKIYDEGTSQLQVFDDVKFIVHAVLDGYNGTILAYGQTGSGKTHTLIGDFANPDEHGVVPRAVAEIGEGIKRDSSGSMVDIKISVVEIYCEKIRDLLDPYCVKDNLQVKQDDSKGIYIEGATEISVLTAEELVDAVQHGLSQRAVSATAMNATSSRSHCIVNVTIQKLFPDGTIQIGKLCMVDLAGSERQDKTGASGSTLAEGSQINKSLSCLANVIYALTDEKIKHIPYRDSKLTRVLQDSLGGTAKTVLIICCSPSTDNAAETLSTLRFGSRAKGVSNIVQVNQKLDVNQLQKQLEAARSKCAELQKEVDKLREMANSSSEKSSQEAHADISDQLTGPANIDKHAACKSMHAPSQPSCLKGKNIVKALASGGLVLVYLAVERHFMGLVGCCEV